jgi:hypothetical protein
MIAAAKCPSCGHLFELRDGFGELLPLSYCASCHSYYPESAGQCRWCGTQPERPPIDGKIVRQIGIGIAVVVGTVFLIQNATSKAEPLPRPKTVASAKNAPAPSTSALDTDIAMARAVQAANDSLASRPVDSPPSVVAQTPVPTVDAAAPKAEPSPPTVVASAIPAAAVPARTAKRPASHWVRSVSRHWVIVRSGASKGSRIVASLGPNSRVELGEARGDWRRIRAKGITGWVEPQSSFEVVAAR